MTANADSRYQTLLQVAAGNRFREDTAALNMTYTASVTAVEMDTPSANHGSKWATFTLLFGIRFPLRYCPGPYRPGSRRTLCVADDRHPSIQAVFGLLFSYKLQISTHIMRRA